MSGVLRRPVSASAHFTTSISVPVITGAGDTNSYAPRSFPFPCGRLVPSKSRDGEGVESAASIAGLPG